MKLKRIIQEAVEIEYDFILTFKPDATRFFVGQLLYAPFADDYGSEITQCGGALLVVGVITTMSQRRKQTDVYLSVEQFP